VLSTPPALERRKERAMQHLNSLEAMSRIVAHDCASVSRGSQRRIIDFVTQKGVSIVLSRDHIQRHEGSWISPEYFSSAEVNALSVGCIVVPITVDKVKRCRIACMDGFHFSLVVIDVVLVSREESVENRKRDGINIADLSAVRVRTLVVDLPMRINDVE
jgi:hypothetical protein